MSGRRMKCLTVYEWKLLLEKRKIVFHVDSESEIALTVTLERVECTALCVGAREFWRNERESRWGMGRAVVLLLLLAGFTIFC